MLIITNLRLYAIHVAMVIAFSVMHFQISMNARSLPTSAPINAATPREATSVTAIRDTVLGERTNVKVRILLLLFIPLSRMERREED